MKDFNTRVNATMAEARQAMSEGKGPHESPAFTQGIEIACEGMRDQSRKLADAAEHLSKANAAFQAAMKGDNKSLQAGTLAAFHFALDQALEAAGS